MGIEYLSNESSTNATSSSALVRDAISKPEFAKASGFGLKESFWRSLLEHHQLDFSISVKYRKVWNIWRNTKARFHMGLLQLSKISIPTN